MPSTQLLRLILISFVLTSSIVSGSDIRYNLVEIPVEWNSEKRDALVNDKGQVFWLDTSTTPAVEYYLPKNDYDLEAGIHRIDLPTDTEAAWFRLYGVTDGGEVYGQLRRNGQFSNTFFATRNRIFVDLGRLKPLNMNDEGIVYGDRLTNNTEDEPFRSPFFVAFDTSTLTDSSTLDSTPVVENSGIFRSYIGQADPKANENGEFRVVRVDRAAYLANDDRAYGVPHFRTWSANQLSFTEQASLVPGTPDGTAEMPNGLSPNNYWSVPSFETSSPKQIVHLNGKGEMIWETSICLSDNCTNEPSYIGQRELTRILYLPEAAYGLPAGHHHLNSSIHLSGNWSSLNKITENGDILVGNQNFIWTSGQLITPHGLLVGGKNAFITQAMDINNRGDYLGVGTIDGGAEKLLLLENKTSLRLELLLPSPYAGIDELVEAQVRLTSLRSDPITIEFPNGLLRTDDEELFDIIFDADLLETTDDGVQSVTLSTDKPVATFDVLIQAKKYGGANLIVDAQTTIDGELQNFQESKTLTVPPVEVSLRALPLIDGEPIVNMELIEGEEEGQFIITDENENVIEPKVEVTVTNNSDVPIKALLQGVDPRARDKSAVVGRIATVGDFPVELKQNEDDPEALIGPGGSVAYEVDLNILEDGRFDFVATVTGSYADNPDATFSTAQKGAPIAVGEPYPVEIEIEIVEDAPAISSINNGAVILQPGGYVPVVASVNNLTSNSTLQFYGIRAKKTLNALGAHLTSEDGRAYNPRMPFVHDHTVDANAAVVLGTGIYTSKEGPGSGLVEWLGLEDAKLIDDETKEETILTEEDILIKNNIDGWLGDPLQVRVVLDRSRPVAPPLTAYQTLEHYSEGVLIGMGDWTTDTFDAIGQLGTLAGYIYEDPNLVYETLGKMGDSLYEIAQFMAETWKEMSEEERREFVEAVAGEVQRRLLLYAVTRSPVTAEDYSAVYDWTLDATYTLFGGVEAAYASDDPAQIAEVWGRVSGHVAMEVITAALSEIKFTKYVKGSEVTKRAKNKSLGAPLTDQEAELRKIVSGPLSDKKVFEVFGPGEEDLRLFEKVFEAFGVKGYARDRNPLSYDLINIRKVAVWKPENMKPKGISKIDLILLGDNLPRLPGADGNPVDLEAVTGIFWPGSDKEVKERLAGLNLSEQVEKACIERAAKRREEFEKYYPKFEQWADGNGIPVSPNLVDNGVPNPPGTENLTRDFEVEVIYRGDDGPALFIPKMANEAGDLRYISGDIDWVHFSFLDGSPLDPDTAYHLYTTLMRCCGMQHPETVTWINKGQSIFKGKINQLAEYVRGENALLEVSGKGARAVRISEKFSRFAKGLNARDHLIFFENGLKSRQRAALADIETAIARFQDVYKVSTPFLWNARMSDPVGDTSIEGSNWLFTDSGFADHIMRQVQDGTYEIFNGLNWEPYTAPTTSSPGTDAILPQIQSDHTIALAPTSVLEADARAGDTQLIIFDLPSEWGALIADHVEHWFSAGDRIVIAPGELTQEVRTIVDVGPFTLDSPLLYDHPAETTVAVIPDSITVGDVANTASALAATVSEDDLTTLIWSTLPGYRYNLEYENSPNNWIVEVENLDSTLNVIAVSIPTASYKPAGNYRLRKTGPTPRPLAMTSFTADPVAGLLELSWTQQPSNEYLIEVSETLQPGSWGTLLPEFFPFGTDVMTVLPLNSSESPRRFYRIRSSDESQTPSEETIIAISYDEESNTTTVTWAAETEAIYQLEASDYEMPETWESLGDPVTASSDSASLTIPSSADLDSTIYRVRTIRAANAYHAWLSDQLENEYGITGGEWITGANEAEAMTTLYVDEDVTRTDIEPEGLPFYKAINLKNSVVPPNNWNDFAFFRTQDAITTGDVLLLVIWVRGKDIGEGLPTIRHNFEITEAPFTKIYSREVVTSDEWTQYIIPMEATFDMPDSWYTMHMGFAVQEIEVGGVAVLNFGNSYTVDQLPKLNVP